MIAGKCPAVLLALLAAVSLIAAASASAASVTISPLPGAPAAMPETQISFLGASAGSLRSISVVGSRSGRHSGHLHGYSAATGASFLPHRPFTPGEHVIVRALWRVGRSARTIGTHFKVALPVAPPSGSFPIAPGTPADVQSFQSEPTLHPPVVTVHQAAGAASAPGYLFAAPFFGPGQWGPMVFDSAGNLVWFHAVPAGDDAADLRTQVFGGKNDLTWWQGRTLILGYGIGEDVIADANYKTVAVVKGGNGLAADEHEFTVLPNGAALVTAYAPVQESLFSVGGAAGAAAVDGALQEIDVRTGLVMWEWDSLGHVALEDSYSKPPTVPSGYYDYFHINAAQALSEGNFLISARNTWGIYKLDGHTGRIIWQLGGKRSTFALGPGVAFAYQHNALLLPNGELSVFDDEGAPTINPPSRGEVIRLDPSTKKATLVSQFVRTIGPVSTGSQGNLQSLPGGGWMVGWGGLPNFTEFNAQGQLIYDAQLPRGENSYRVYRLPWAGQPTTGPAIAAHSSGGVSTVYASWNGATTVSSWQLLSGPSASQLSVVSTTLRSGFETTIPAPAASLYEVRALSASGRVLAASQAISASP
ncbi:MAG TPA: arylsulfotransferase family protein [Solirubrobacteraceae bacterium]|nr:arylsulfotransferase family protein [Solirubrobacteraceae bacterium]